MATQPPPNLFTDQEREVASYLLELSSVEPAPLPLEKIRWGAKRRRNEPPYQFKPEPDRAEPAGPDYSDEEKRKKEETASPATPLCFPNSGSDEQIATPPAKLVKKANCQKERLKEKKEQVALLSKEKADLNREFQQLQERFRMLTAMKILLRDQNSKLLRRTEVCAVNKVQSVGPTQTAAWSAFVGKPPHWAPPTLIVPPAIERPRMEIDLNEPADEGAEWAVAPSLTCQSDREEKAAKSAEARKRRLDIQRERRISPSAVQKRPRVR